jgi:hypothetical protein
MSEPISARWVMDEVAKWSPDHLNTRLQVAILGEKRTVATRPVIELVITDEGPILEVRL